MLVAVGPRAVETVVIALVAGRDAVVEEVVCVEKAKMLDAADVDVVIADEIDDTVAVPAGPEAEELEASTEVLPEPDTVDVIDCGCTLPTDTDTVVATHPLQLSVAVAVAVAVFVVPGTVIRTVCVVGCTSTTLTVTDSSSVTVTVCVLGAAVIVCVVSTVWV